MSDKDAFKKYLSDLCDYIIISFGTYGIDLDFERYDLTIYRHYRRDNLTGVNMKFYLIIDKDSGIVDSDMKVFQNFIRDTALKYFTRVKPNAYPYKNIGIKAIDGVYVHDTWSPQGSKNPKRTHWHVEIDAIEGYLNVKSLGQTIDDVAKNLGKFKPATEVTMNIYRTTGYDSGLKVKEPTGQINLKIKYKRDTLTNNTAFKYGDVFESQDIIKLDLWKHGYFAAYIVAKYKPNPDIYLIWPVDSHQAYLTTKADLDDFIAKVKQFGKSNSDVQGSIQRGN